MTTEAPVNPRIAATAANLTKRLLALDPDVDEIVLMARIVVRKGVHHAHEFSNTALLADTVRDCGYYPQPDVAGRNLATVTMTALSPEHGPLHHYVRALHAHAPVSRFESGGKE